MAGQKPTNLTMRGTILCGAALVQPWHRVPGN